jgi:hypothetical protein
LQRGKKQQVGSGEPLLPGWLSTATRLFTVALANMSTNNTAITDLTSNRSIIDTGGSQINDTVKNNPTTTARRKQTRQPEEVPEQPPGKKTKTDVPNRTNAPMMSLLNERRQAIQGEQYRARAQKAGTHILGRQENSGEEYIRFWSKKEISECFKRSCRAVTECLDRGTTLRCDHTVCKGQTWEFKEAPISTNNSGSNHRGMQDDQSVRSGQGGGAARTSRSSSASAAASAAELHLLCSWHKNQGKVPAPAPTMWAEFPVDCLVIVATFCGSAKTTTLVAKGWGPTGLTRNFRISCGFAAICFFGRRRMRLFGMHPEHQQTQQDGQRTSASCVPTTPHLPVHSMWANSLSLSLPDTDRGDVVQLCRWLGTPGCFEGLLELVIPYSPCGDRVFAAIGRAFEERARWGSRGLQSLNLMDTGATAAGYTALSRGLAAGTCRGLVTLKVGKLYVGGGNKWGVDSMLALSNAFGELQSLRSLVLRGSEGRKVMQQQVMFMYSDL